MQTLFFPRLSVFPFVPRVFLLSRDLASRILPSRALNPRRDPRVCAQRDRFFSRLLSHRYFQFADSRVFPGDRPAPLRNQRRASASALAPLDKLPIFMVPIDRLDPRANTNLEIRSSRSPSRSRLLNYHFVRDNHIRGDREIEFDSRGEQTIFLSRVDRDPTLISDPNHSSAAHPPRTIPYMRSTFQSVGRDRGIRIVEFRGLNRAKREGFERRRRGVFARHTVQMLAVPAGWRLDLSLPGMQILHKLYTSDVGRRTCMRFDETRRRMEREARGQPNTAPSSLPPSSRTPLRSPRRAP